MYDTKKITVSLVAILSVLIAYTVFSRNNSIKTIKNLTKELKAQSDSIGIIHKRYDSLANNYQLVYKRFEQTSNQLDSLKENVEDIMHSNITSANSIKSSLRRLIEHQDTITVLPLDSPEIYF